MTESPNADEPGKVTEVLTEDAAVSVLSGAPKKVRKRRKGQGDEMQDRQGTAEEVARNSNTVQPRAAQKKRPVPASTRPALADLPPDRQAEIAGRRLAGAARRKHVYRPEVPEIQKDIELHTHEIGLLFTRDFKACNEYAVAIDYVARERLTNRAEYNKYLEEFQETLNALSQAITDLYGRYEERSNRGMTTSKRPMTVLASVQSNRSLQLLDLFKTADDIIRMVQYLHIFGDLPDDEASQAATTVEKALSRCSKGLRNVKLKCFRRIVELESLRLPVSVETSIEELEGARRIAAIKKGDNKSASIAKPLRKKAAVGRPMLDPSAQAGQLVNVPSEQQAVSMDQVVAVEQPTDGEKPKAEAEAQAADESDPEADEARATAAE